MINQQPLIVLLIVSGFFLILMSIIIIKQLKAFHSLKKIYYDQVRLRNHDQTDFCRDINLKSEQVNRMQKEIIKKNYQINQLMIENDSEASV